eukprot:Skav207040  [mRNA]  locus=scaffold975:198961:208505:- [translate_table: standard]
MEPLDHRILAAPVVGTPYDSVFTWLGLADEKMIQAYDVAQQREVLIHGSWEGGATVTIYNLHLVDAELMIFAMDADTQVFESKRSDTIFTPRLVELCAGTGAMGVGPLFLGCQVVASVDHSPLACRHLELNGHGSVHQLDLNLPSTALTLHECVGTEPVTLLLGFPCQPFSRQGSQAGQDDPRSLTFWSALRIAFLLQAQLLITECVPEAQHDESVRRGLSSLASVMKWGVHSTCLRLEHQWPMARSRWWSALYPLTWTGKEIERWPVSTAFPSIGHILPSWGLWDANDEHDLQLTVEEFQCYTDPRFGSEPRLLHQSRRCPTILHSYGSPLTDCPCGCRGPLSLRSLETKGLRGVFVHSACTSMPRYLHPRELAVLLGLPLTMDFVFPARDALCLLGLVASPLQSLWIFSLVFCAASSRVPGLAPLDPLEVLGRYKSVLLQQVHDCFPFAVSVRPVDFVLSQPDGPPIHLMSRGTSTMAQLASAEAISLDWGEKAMIHDLQNRPVPLESHVTHGQVEVQVKIQGRRQTKEKPTGFFMVTLKLADRIVSSFVVPGTFLFTVFWEHDVATTTLFADVFGKIHSADFKVWGTVYLEELSPTRFPTLRPFRPPVVLLPQTRDSTSAGFGSGGLDDVAVWRTMIEFASVVPTCMVSPRDACRLLDDATASVEFHGLSSSSSEVYVIFQSEQHWALLQGILGLEGIHWTYFDGLSSRLVPHARLLADGLSRQLGLLPVSFEVACHIKQVSDNTCGTVALCHLALCLGMRGSFAPGAVDFLHQCLLRRNHKASWFSGLGPSTTDVQARLAAVLATKGVPSSSAADRAAAAIQKLGLLPVHEALTEANPWKALKSLTTKPGNGFQFVLKAELHEYIDQKANARHGVALTTKKKEKRNSKKPNKEEWTLDPSQLTLEPGLFVDAEGDMVSTIRLAEVTADSRGIAICSLVEAAPYLHDAKHISADALALLVVEEIASGDRRHADISALRFPAVYVPTGDPLLINGSIVQLGDMEVVRKQNDDPVDDMEVTSTHVLKVQLFRDELGQWEPVIQAPIKNLLLLIPCLRLCTRLDCDHRCGLFHMTVEEPIEQVIYEVWGRRYQTTDGKKVDADKADVFQAFLRVAFPALETILKTQAPGVYFEPRSDSTRATDESYAVVWIPGANREAALHKLKLATHGLGLVRMKFRFGIRVLAAHEERTHRELRPGDGFNKVCIHYVYKIHPVPHGLQRQQVVKLLAEWKWLAKPLQPSKGSSEGAAWEVGATVPPPMMVLHAFGRDVLITLLKDKEEKPAPPHVVGPKRVRRQMLAHGATSSTSSSSDPWQNGSDPWARFMSGTCPTTNKVPSRMASLTDQLKEDVKVQVQQQLDAGNVPSVDTQRLSKLEVDVAELKAQGSQFRSWFEETGTRLATQDQQLTRLHEGLTQQQSDIHAVRSEVHTSAENLHQALQTSFGSMQHDITTDLNASISAQLERFEKVIFAKFPRLAASVPVEWFPCGSSGVVSASCVPLVEPSAVAWTPCSVDFFPWGEALNPGPPLASPGVVPFSFANPSGLRTKEEMVLSMGVGVHSFAETQLSHQTQRSCAKSLRSLAAQEHRDLRVHFGAPAALRANSDWAGGWTGVATVSDWPSREVQLPYSNERDCGRLLVTEHFFGSQSVQCATVYGFPVGPTWPQARALTSSLLQILSTEIVLGSSGPRIIGGDFNAECGALEAFDFWSRLGWQNAQCFAHQAWYQEPRPTCKNATSPDMVWMSPEAVALCRYVDVAELFSEHATVTVGLSVDGCVPPTLVWPLPSPIPWAHVDSTWLDSVQPPLWDREGSCDAQWAQLGASVESSLDGFVSSQPSDSLQAAQRGRLQRTAPQLRPAQPSSIKASRPSEVLLRNDLVGSSTKFWFRQLRRLQSFLHSARSGKTTVNATVYRLELWTAIRKASGFSGGFCNWWRYHRSSVLPGSPALLPLAPPDAVVAELIFVNFKECFERYESWHVRQRASLLRAKYDQGIRALYHDLRKGRKGSLDCLTSTTEYGVLAVDEPIGQVHVDHEVNLLGQNVWSLDDQRVSVTSVNEVVLQMDCPCEVGQSYCWALSKQLRDSLVGLPMDVVTQATELGGIMSFTKRQHTGLLQSRLAKLLPRWDLLRASRAPLCQKLISLATVFWASALHGANGSGAAVSTVTKLRSLALKTLGLNRAGVNGLLRLSLSSTPKADPGFWLLTVTFHSFRRLAYKEPRLMAGLVQFLSCFDGKLFSGPYSHLVDSCTSLGWSLQPPFFFDHDGCRHHLLSLDDSSLDELLWDAWLQHIARSVNHRLTMQDLDGLDPHLVRADRSQLDALETSLLGSLQSGAFIATSTHAKYDATKHACCSRCGVENTQPHMLECPCYESIRNGISGWGRDPECDTTALSVHLLPSRNPDDVLWKQLLLDIPDSTADFHSCPSSADFQHLFTDGSAMTGAYGYAAWGCLNATTGQVVSCGHVPGLGQCSDRAELWGAISALKWWLRYQVPVHLWMDAKHVSDGLAFLREHGHAGPWKNHDLWNLLSDLLAQGSDQMLEIHWAPSHLDDNLMENAYEDWIRLWNNRVDRMAGHFNRARSVAFQRLHLSLTTRHEKLRSRMQMYRQFWFGVAKGMQQPSTDTVGSVADTFADDDQVVLSDLVVGDVAALCEPLSLRSPIRFLISILEWILEHECRGASVYPLSFVELTLCLAGQDFGLLSEQTLPSVLRRCPSCLTLTETGCCCTVRCAWQPENLSAL